METGIVLVTLLREFFALEKVISDKILEAMIDRCGG